MISKSIFPSMVLAAFYTFVIAASIAQTPQTKSEDELKKQMEEVVINNLIFEARTQTPEIAADALITIAESGRVSKAELKRRILEEAFGLASQAQYSVRIRYAGYMDTAVFFRYNPLELKLDRLSLQFRVIRALLKFDKARARELFLREMPPDFDLPPLGCENTIRYYDVADYYETASAVFNETFTAKERGSPAFFYVILPFVERIASPAQVNPVAKMLAGLKLSQSQLSLVSATYTQALMKVRNDDPTFRQAILNTRGIREFIKTFGETKTGNRQQLIDAVREYALKQLNGVRCSDGIKKNLTNPLISKYVLPGYIKDLNDEILKEKPIGAEEIDPENIVRATRPPYYWDSKKSNDRQDSAKRLKFRVGGNEFSEEEKQKPEWQAELDKYLLDLGMWDEQEEDTKEDFVNKKSVMFLNLLNGIVPKGSGRDAVFKDYILFLSRNELRGESRLQWFWLVRDLIRIVERAEGEERAKMINIIEGFNNPTLKLYIDLIEFKLKGSPTQKS